MYIMYIYIYKFVLVYHELIQTNILLFMQGFHLTLIGHVPHPTLQNLSLHKDTTSFSFSADVLRSCLTVQSSLSLLAQKRAAAIDMPHGVLPTLPLPFFKGISKLCTAVFTLYEYSWPKPFFQHVQGASSSAELKNFFRLKPSCGRSSNCQMLLQFG